MLDLVSHPELLAEIDSLSGHGDNLMHQFDIFRHDVRRVELFPHEPAGTQLEDRIKSVAREVSHGWGKVKSVVCLDMTTAEVSGESMRVGYSMQPYNIPLAIRRLNRQALAAGRVPLVPPTRVATGATSAMIAQFVGREWLLLGPRASGTIDIGVLQLVGTGSMDVGDLAQPNPYEYRLRTEVSEETGLARQIIKVKPFSFAGSLRYWNDCGLNSIVHVSEILSARIFKDFDTLLRHVGRASSASAGYSRLNLHLPQDTRNRLEQFGPVLGLGKISQEHTMVLGLPMAGLMDFYLVMKHAMASYTRPLVPWIHKMWLDGNNHRTYG
jgi:hypothetical protein